MKTSQDKDKEETTAKEEQKSPSQWLEKIPKFWEKPLAKANEIYQNNQTKLKSRKFWLILAVALGLTGGTGALLWNWYKIESNLPKSVEDVLTYTREGTINIEAVDGTVLQQIGPVTHDRLKIWEVPEAVKEAFIASEDRRFYEHKGVDVQGIIRAAFTNLLARDVVEGGSTITQQLARIVYLTQERSIVRKVREIRVAQRIDDTLSKDQILESYLNLVYLGSGAYGVADAAWVYYSKTPEQLTLSEAATIAGIVPAPSVYSPIENPQLAKQMRDRVLKKMQEEGMITDREANDAIASPIATKPSQPKRLEWIAPYFTEYVQKELPKLVSEKIIKQGGLTVETTLNPKWQAAAEKALERTVSREGRWQRFSQGALVAIDPRNGQIRAMVGGKSFERNQFNRVTQAKRQPGSTFKAFVYTTAIAAGFSPYRSYLDAEYTVDGYKPENYGDSYSGKYISLYSALSKSLNVVAVQTLVDVGWNPVIETAKKMGIESKLEPTYSLALGAWEVNLLELTSAYGTLANQGIHEQAYGISRILDRKGNILYQAKHKSQQALTKDTSAIMTWMLRGVVNNGTGQPAQIGRPVAGKTGTSDKARDLWFVGYIPQMVTGVWFGNDDNRPTWGMSTSAAATWGRFMRQVVEDMPIEKFPSIPRRFVDSEKTVKAEPLRPRRRSLKMPVKKEVSDASNLTNNIASSSNSRSRRRRTMAIVEPSENNPSPTRRRRRRYNNSLTTATTQQIQPTTPTNTEPTRRRRRRRVIENVQQPGAKQLQTAPTNTRTRRRSRRSASVNQTQPSTSTGIPPAPPASRKQE